MWVPLVWFVVQAVNGKDFEVEYNPFHSNRIAQKLWEQWDYRFNLARGYHCCDLCSGKPSKILLINPLTKKECLLGRGEIHIEGGNGEWYFAPDMIIHYIMAHRYKPPKVFEDALFL